MKPKNVDIVLFLNKNLPLVTHYQLFLRMRTVKVLIHYSIPTILIPKLLGIVSKFKFLVSPIATGDYCFIHYTSLSMASRVCRLYSDLVEAKRATNLFSAVGMQNNWVSRITSLLDVIVSRDYGKLQ